jgi:hypothetical protein
MYWYIKIDRRTGKLIGDAQLAQSLFGRDSRLQVQGEAFDGHQLREAIMAAMRRSAAVVDATPGEEEVRRIYTGENGGCHFVVRMSDGHWYGGGRVDIREAVHFPLATAKAEAIRLGGEVYDAKAGQAGVVWRNY